MGASRDPLVGRRVELAFLGDRLADARAGLGHVVLVCGPAGIGKTRLVEELAAAADGIQVGWGGAVDDAGMPPLWPWVRAVRDLPGTRTALASMACSGPTVPRSVCSGGSRRKPGGFRCSSSECTGIRRARHCPRRSFIVR